MFTKLPNWGEEYNFAINDTGFFTLLQYDAGEKYFDRKTSQYLTVKFTNVYFKEFIKDNQIKTIKIKL